MRKFYEWCMPCPLIGYIIHRITHHTNTHIVRGLVQLLENWVCSYFVLVFVILRGLSQDRGGLIILVLLNPIINKTTFEGRYPRSLINICVHLSLLFSSFLAIVESLKSIILAKIFLLILPGFCNNNNVVFLFPTLLLKIWEKCCW